jgi:phosphatidylserine decarboxylase
VLSAADGRVIYIKKIDAGQVPVSEKNGRQFSLDEFAGTKALGSSGYLVGTAMTYLDVHVNRAPVAGKVRLLKHIGGLFDSLKHPESIFQNERVSTVIETSGMTIGVVQIASRMVRNIVPLIREGEFVQQGQRIGKIRFGSQVDLILPDTPGLRIIVAPGDKLKAGLSVIARY